MIPKHIAIIMDGNGRWAKDRNLDRSVGHIHGVESVRRVIRYSKELGIKYLTLYSFSTENFKRPKKEVFHLMKLVKDYFENDIKELNSQGVRVKILGNKNLFSKVISNLIDSAEEITKDNLSLNVNFAFGYGSRAEIINAVNEIIKEGIKKVDHKEFSKRLYTNDIPDVDLLIRTGGELRISNFLLYQIAYSELYFCDTMWPDFNEKHLNEAIEEFKLRKRRYGGL